MTVSKQELQAAQEFQAPAVAGQPVDLIQVIERASRDPSVDVDKMDRLMQMYESLESKRAEVAFNNAMTAAQQEIVRVAPNKENQQTRSVYADYAALDRAIRPVYIKHGFSLSFDTGDSAENMVTVLCYVAHNGGHTRTYRTTMPADGKGAKGGDVMTRTHAAGSAMSYGQRYLLKLIFNIAVGQDDDGNGAGEKVNEEQQTNIQALIDEVKPNVPAFLKYFKVLKISELPAAQYQNAVAMLEKKRKQS